MSHSYSFTSESVGAGHPDKMADQISDAVLDALLREDKYSRVACEALLTTGLAVVAGEIKTTAYVDIGNIVRQTIKNIGYDDARLGFDGDTCAVMLSIDEQSPDIAQGVDIGGAGDQGMMFGYACNESEAYMPLPIYLSHQLMLKHAEVRCRGIVPYLRPDAKSQVTIRYEDNRPLCVETIVLSTQHADGYDSASIRADVIENIVTPAIPTEFQTNGYEVLVNPTGRFVIGGPQGDTGLTGRKIIVDTYGGMARHGGGAFSGKDPTKVDRSGAYAARWIAKHIVASGAADRCELQIAYAIGVTQPVSIMVNTFDTERVSTPAIHNAVTAIFDLTPAGIIESLDLLRPIYTPTAAYGHFGRKPEDGTFPWEELSRLGDVCSALGIEPPVVKTS